MVLSSISDQDWHFWVFVKDLLDATVIDALPGVFLTGGTILSLILGVAEVFGMGEIIWRLAAGVAARGRGGTTFIESWLE